MTGWPPLVEFPGWKKPGKWHLKLLPKRFETQLSAADFWDTLDGQAHEAAFFSPERLDYAPAANGWKRELTVPSLAEDEMPTRYSQQIETVALAACLAHLRQSSSAWSIHRGMKDTMVVYALPYMGDYSQRLAITPPPCTSSLSSSTFGVGTSSWSRWPNRPTPQFWAMTEIMDTVMWWEEHLDVPAEGEVG